MKILKLLFALSLLISVSLQAQEAHWELVRENFWGKIAIDPINSNIIYVSPGNVEQWGLHKSMDGGKTWTYYGAGYEGIGAEGILIDPNDPKRLWIYGNGFKGVVRSEDGGMTAVKSDTGIIFDHHGYAVTAFAYDHRRDILYAGDYTTFLGIYRSKNGGRRWELVHVHGRPALFEPKCFLVQEDSGWVYSGSVSYGIWRSKDGAATWEALQPETFAQQNISFITRVPNSRTLYAAGGQGRVFKSYDLGESWFSVSTAALDSAFLWGGLLVSSLDTNYVYLGSHGGSDYRKGGFFMTRDNGRTWQIYHRGLPLYEFSRYLTWDLTQAPESDHVYMSMRSPMEQLYQLSQAELTSVQERPSSSVPSPSSFIIQQNYPNPFRSETRIDFSLSAKNAVKLEIYNIKGEHVAGLINKHLEAGQHSVFWNGKDSKGGDVVTGIYLIRLSFGKTILTRRMLLIR